MHGILITSKVANILLHFQDVSGKERAWPQNLLLKARALFPHTPLPHPLLRTVCLPTPTALARPGHWLGALWSADINSEIEVSPSVLSKGVSHCWCTELGQPQRAGCHGLNVHVPPKHT